MVILTPGILEAVLMKYSCQAGATPVHGPVISAQLAPLVPTGSLRRNQGLVQSPLPLHCLSPKAARIKSNNPSRKKGAESTPGWASLH